MSDCTHDRSDLITLLRDDVAPVRRRRLAERVDGCEACAEELRAIRRTWGGLPAAPAGGAPGRVREEVLAYAGDAVAGKARVMADLWRAVRPAAVIASLGGYLILSLLHPIPSTVEFCQVRIFRDPAMSLGQVCLVYAGVAALYAGVPVGVTAYLSSSGGDGWRVGLAEATVFTLLALPVLGLQFGLEDLAITGTVLAGVALGAAAGGFAGGLARTPRRAMRAGG